MTVRQEDKAKVRNVKVITSEECVPKHKLLVVDIWFKATKRRRRKLEPRVRVWKFKEEKTCEEYRCMVGDKVEEVKWKSLGVNNHWQQMKGIMMETAFLRLLQDSLYGFHRLFTATSEHIRLFTF